MENVKPGTVLELSSLSPSTMETLVLLVLIKQSLALFLIGEADQRVQGKTGLKNYNIKLVLSLKSGDGKSEDSDSSGEKPPEVTDIGILYDEARKCVMKGGEKFLIIFPKIFY